MRFLLLATLFIGLSSEACELNSGCKPSAIIGTWYFDHIIYQGEERPPFNPNLEMTFGFSATGESHLFWFRNNEVGFCERKGIYSYENCGLTDTVTWLNPQNSVECSLDPDMQLGHTTITYVAIDEKDFLHLHMQMGEEELIYVLRHVDNYQN